MVHGSRDGQDWIRLASTFETVAEMDVKDVRLYLDDAYRSGKGITGMMRPGSYRYVRFDFAARQAKDAFELCEVELWGKLPRQ